MTALNNSAFVLLELRQWAKAEERLRKVIQIKRPFGGSFFNLVNAQVRLGKITAAESTVAQFRQRMQDNEEIWESDWIVQWGRGDIRAADSIAQAVQKTARSMRQGTRSASNLAGTAFLRGRIRDGMRWRTEEHEAVYRPSRAPDRPLQIVLDSALGTAFFLQNVERARAMVRRALARTPMAQISPASRPWNSLGELAATLHDAQLAREALDGFEKDIPQLGLVSADAERARMRAWLAFGDGAI